METNENKESGSSESMVAVGSDIAKRVQNCRETGAIEDGFGRIVDDDSLQGSWNELGACFKTIKSHGPFEHQAVSPLSKYFGVVTGDLVGSIVFHLE